MAKVPFFHDTSSSPLRFTQNFCVTPQKKRVWSRARKNHPQQKNGCEKWSPIPLIYCKFYGDHDDSPMESLDWGLSVNRVLPNLMGNQYFPCHRQGWNTIFSYHTHNLLAKTYIRNIYEYLWISIERCTQHYLPTMEKYNFNFGEILKHSHLWDLKITP